MCERGAEEKGKHQTITPFPTPHERNSLHCFMCEHCGWVSNAFPKGNSQLSQFEYIFFLCMARFSIKLNTSRILGAYSQCPVWLLYANIFKLQTYFETINRFSIVHFNWYIRFDQNQWRARKIAIPTNE